MATPRVFARVVGAPDGDGGCLVLGDELGEFNVYFRAGGDEATIRRVATKIECLAVIEADDRSVREIASAAQKGADVLASVDDIARLANDLRNKANTVRGAR